MRRVLLLIVFVLLSGCTLNYEQKDESNTPRVVTATLGIALNPPAVPTAVTPVAQLVILPSQTPLPVTPTVRPGDTPTLAASQTQNPEATVEAIVVGTLDAMATAATPVLTETAAATGTPAPPPTATPIPTETPTAGPTLTPTETPLPTAIPPTRTRPGPPTVLPMDDGSGNVVPGTGSTSQGTSPIAGVDALPDTLYFLSDQGSLQQVWRLPVGYTFPVQVTFSPTGVAAFDVSKTGSLAYLTTAGEMVTDGIPFLPPAGPGGTYPRVTALAWSPGGDWLAYTLETPGAAGTLTGLHAVDGLWIRSISQGTTIPLAMNTYGETPRLYGGPLDWRPDGSEVLVKTTLESGDAAYSRVNISSTAVSPLWDGGDLAPGVYHEARWNVNGSAIIAGGAEGILSIEPDTLGVQTLVDADAGFNPTGAVQFASGALTFVGGDTDRQLYLAPSAQSAPQPVAPTLSTSGRLDFLWDNLGQETILVVYEPPESPLGIAYLHDTVGTVYDLTVLTGLVGSPVWGPVFRSGDPARVHTTEGDTLNVRDVPNGNVLVALANGSSVTVTGGPRDADGMRWWRVQTRDGVSGWAVESVLDDNGQPLRTLLPAN